MKTHTLVFLNDGETYTEVDECEIVTLTAKGLQLLEEGYSLDQISSGEILSFIRLNNNLN